MRTQGSEPQEVSRELGGLQLAAVSLLGTGKVACLQFIRTRKTSLTQMFRSALMRCGAFLEMHRITGEHLLKVMLISVSLNRCLITNLSHPGRRGNATAPAAFVLPSHRGVTLFLAVKILVR